MSSNINLYGDQLIKTSGSHGSDIASQRIDDLDRKCLIFAATHAGRKCNAIEIGSGSGSFGCRLAALDFRVSMYDLIDEPLAVKLFNDGGLLPSINYYKYDVSQIDKNLIPEEVLIVYSQRTIHYLKYNDAISLLRIIRTRMSRNGVMFISASGIESELGFQYPKSDIEKRFHKLHPDMQEKHDIREAVCLYSREDLNLLCQTSGFRVEESWQSTFGNIKLVCSPKS